MVFTYIDRVSFTYGNPRKHIWTCAVGLSEDRNYNNTYVYNTCSSVKMAKTIVDPLVCVTQVWAYTLLGNYVNTSVAVNIAHQQVLCSFQ